MPSTEASQNAEQNMDYRLRFLDSNLKSYGNGVLDMPDIFNEEQLKQYTKSYGQPGFKIDPQIEYLAGKLGVDPLTVLNKQLKANGMNELRPSPAMRGCSE